MWAQANRRPVNQEGRTLEHGSKPRITDAFPVHGNKRVSKRHRADGFLSSAGRFLSRCPITESHLVCGYPSHVLLPFGSYPFSVTIGKALVLPDGNCILDLVDDLPARIECLSALRAGDGHDNGDITNLKVTDTVNG